MKKEIFKDSFTVGTYCLAQYCRDEEHIRDLSLCGIDLIIGLGCIKNDKDRELFDLMEKYGVKAIVSGAVPSWFGGHGENSGTMEENKPIDLYREAALSFTDHPSIIGIDIGDEPSALDLPHYGKVFDAMRVAFPEKFIYLNLYPSYGMLASNTREQTSYELGTDTYEEYLKAYVGNCKTDYLSLDHYMYSSSKESFISDLDTASRICQEGGRRLFAVLQANSHTPLRRMTENSLRSQASLALSFGVRGISWACYSDGWWYHNVIDKNGDKTEVYHDLKRVNKGIKLIAEKYDGYAFIRNIRLAEGDGPFDLDIISVTAIKGKEGISVGLFRHRTDEGKKCLFISSLDNDEETNETSLITFRLKEEKEGRVLFRSFDGEKELEDKEGTYSLMLDSCTGGMVIIE